jgi:hypothetical protein
MPKRKKQEILQSLRPLWRVDDEQWLIQRQADWQHISATMTQTPPAKQKSLERYFVYGEKDCYFPGSTVMLFTPYDSAESVKEVFYSGLLDPTEQENVFKDYLFWISKRGYYLSWFRRHIQQFIQGVMGSNYQELYVEHGSRPKLISIEPSWWCKAYILCAKKVLVGEVAYEGCVDCVEYFVSALAQASKSCHRYQDYFDEMFAEVERILAGAEASDIAKTFAHDLKARESEIRHHWQLSGEKAAEIDAQNATE